MSYFIIERPLANGGKAALGRAHDSDNPDDFGIVAMRIGVAERPEDAIKFHDRQSAEAALDCFTDTGQLPEGERFKEPAWNEYPSNNSWGAVEVAE